MKIASCSPKNNGCFWYRNKTPFDALKRKGVETVLADFGDPVDPETGIVQLSRSYGPGYEEFFWIVKELGMKVWYDVDDAIDLVVPENPFAYANKKTLGSYYFLLHESDFITTSSEYLAEHLRAITKKPVHVFPNYINPTEWKERPHAAKELRIGFAGSASHMKDINIILPVIEELQKKYTFKFVLYGLDANCNGDIDIWHERQIKNCGDSYKTSKYGIEVEKAYRTLQNINVEFVDCVRWELHPKTLAKLDLDIGLCPLIDDEFNHCKTPIKFYEYAMVGTTALCSNVSPFKDEALALTDNDFTSWYDSLEALIMYDELRRSTLAAQQDYVKKNRLIDDHIDTLVGVINEYAKKKEAAV